MTVDDYIDRFGFNAGEWVRAVIHRAYLLTDLQKAELVLAVGEDSASAVKKSSLDLVDEAAENMRLAKQLRDTVIDPATGSILASVSDASKTLLAIDKLIDTASKRFQLLYNQSTQAAMEEAVKETLSDMDKDLQARFLNLLESKLRTIR